MQEVQVLHNNHQRTGLVEVVVTGSMYCLSVDLAFLERCNSGMGSGYRDREDDFDPL